MRWKLDFLARFQRPELIFVELSNKNLQHLLILENLMSINHMYAVFILHVLTYGSPVRSYVFVFSEKDSNKKSETVTNTYLQKTTREKNIIL